MYVRSKNRGRKVHGPIILSKVINKIKGHFGGRMYVRSKNRGS